MHTHESTSTASDGAAPRARNWRTAAGQALRALRPRRARSEPFLLDGIEDDDLAG